MKSVNRYTSNEFHDWQRKNLPSGFVLQDIDTWALVLSDSSNDYEPFALVELKRSFKDPRDWQPYLDDLPNFMSLHRMALRARLPLWILYFKKDETITDSTLFHVFLVKEVSAESGHRHIDYDDLMITAQKFKDHFPKIF